MKKRILSVICLVLLLAICLASCKETVSVVGAEVNADGDLIITMSDGTAQNLGKVKGADSQIGASADNPQCLDFYPLPDGTYAVSLGEAIYLENIVIPATYNGKAVTKMVETDSNLDKKGGIKTISLPDSITAIDEDVFAGCIGLESINIPSGVTSIGNKAFYNCSSLTSITIPNGVTSIGVRAFYDCSSLESVTFIDPDGWKADSAPLNASDLKNHETAAELLTDTYKYYYWTKATE